MDGGGVLFVLLVGGGGMARPVSLMIYGYFLRKGQYDMLHGS